MSSSTYQLQRILPPLSTAMGILGVGGGIYGILNPLAFSSTLGIPISTSSSPALPFVSFAAARNLGSGVSILALLYIGQRKVLGMLLMCGVMTAWADAGICFQFDRFEGKALGHAFMGVVLGLLGAGMYWA